MARSHPIARIEARLASLDGKLLEQIELFPNLSQENTASATSQASNALLAAGSGEIHVRCAQLDAENGRLMQVNKALEDIIEQLRKDLAQVSSELAHSAKWLRLFEDENARLTEFESTTES